MPEVDAIIMAAGQSKRMGTQKLLLPFADTTLLEYFLQRFPYHLFTHIYLVYNDIRVAEVAGNFRVTLLYNSVPQNGQSVSIRLGVEKSQAEDGMLFTVADQPFLAEDVIEKLIQEFSENKEKIVRPLCNNKPQNPVIFPRYCCHDLLNIEGDKGGREVISLYPNSLHYINFSRDISFKDADTLEDYKILLMQLQNEKR